MTDSEITITLDRRTASMVATACLAVVAEETTPENVAECLNTVVDDIIDQLG